MMMGKNRMNMYDTIEIDNLFYDNDVQHPMEIEIAWIGTQTNKKYSQIWFIFFVRHKSLVIVLQMHGWVDVYFDFFLLLFLLRVLLLFKHWLIDIESARSQPHINIASVFLSIFHLFLQNNGIVSATIPNNSE